MVTVAAPHVHSNGVRGGPQPATAPASLIGKTLAVTRPAARRDALTRAAGRAWRAFRPAALLTAGFGCATAAAYVAAGLWPGLLATAASLVTLDWLSRPPRPPVIVDPDAPDSGTA